jgi:hypothetical protein
MGLQPLNADIEVHGRSPFANAMHFARVARAVDSLLVNVTPDLWSASTPCTDWDLARTSSTSTTASPPNSPAPHLPS